MHPSIFSLYNHIISIYFAFIFILKKGEVNGLSNSLPSKNNSFFSRQIGLYNPFNPNNTNFEIKTITSGLPYTGDGEDKLKAYFQNPFNFVFDNFQNLYLTDPYVNTIRMINSSTNIISTIGGNGTQSFSPDGNFAKNSSLFYPNYLTIDKENNLLYFAETYPSYRIRSINLNSNILSTIGGNGINSFTPDGNFAKNSSLNFAGSLTLDKKRNLLYFIELNRIRSINLNSNILSTIGGNGTTIIAQIDGSFANQTGINNPQGLALDSIGDFLYYSDSGNSIIRRIDFNNNNRVFTISGKNGNSSFFGENINSSLALLNTPTNLFFSSIENSLYFLDSNNYRIRKISFNNTGNNLNLISTFLGNGIVSFIPIKGGDFRLNISIDSLSPINSINQDLSQALFFLKNNKVFRVDINGFISIYSGIGNLNQLNGYNAYFGQLNNPNGIFVDKNNNLIICDSYNNKIKKIITNNIPQIILDFAGTGNLTFNGENLPSLQSNLHFPNSIISDNFGNFYFSDQNNLKIRKIDNSTNNFISTIGGNEIIGFTPDGNSALNSSLNKPNYLTFDNEKNILYFIETNSYRIRSIDLNSNNLISTIGGNGINGFTPDNNFAKNSSLSLSVYLVFNKKINLLYFIESYFTGGIKIRSIDLNSNLLSTIGGNGINGFTPDNNFAKNSSFERLNSMTCDLNGNIYFVEVLVSNNYLPTNFSLRFINISDGILKTIYLKQNSENSQNFYLTFDLNQNLYFLYPQTTTTYPILQFIFNPINNNQITTDFILNQTSTSSNQGIIPTTTGNNINNNNSFPLILLLSILLPILFVLLLVGIILILVFYFKRRKNNKETINSIQLNDLQSNEMGLNLNLKSTLNSNQKLLSNIQIEKEIGSGQFGKVFKGKWNKSVFVAMKTLTNEEAMKDFFDEMNMLEKIKHPNTIQYFGIYKENLEGKEFSFIVTEFMNKGSLLNLLQENDNNKNKNNNSFSSFQLLDFCKQACNGMIYLSSQNIIHRDLALRNLLVHQENSNSSFIIKIGDFGLSRLLENHYYTTSSDMIPIKWSPPEVLQKRKFSIQSDIWSFGIVIWEIFSFGKKPYLGLSNNEAAEKIQEGYRLENPNEKICSKEIYSLMLDCWKNEPNERPNFNQIYERLN